MVDRPWEGKKGVLGNDPFPLSLSSRLPSLAMDSRRWVVERGRGQATPLCRAMSLSPRWWFQITPEARTRRGFCEEEEKVMIRLED